MQTPHFIFVSTQFSFANCQCHNCLAHLSTACAECVRLRAQGPGVHVTRVLREWEFSRSLARFSPPTFRLGRSCAFGSSARRNDSQLTASRRSNPPANGCWVGVARHRGEMDSTLGLSCSHFLDFYRLGDADSAGSCLGAPVIGGSCHPGGNPSAIARSHRLATVGQSPHVRDVRFRGFHLSS